MSRYKFESLVKAQKRLGRIAGETNKYGIDGFTRDDLEQLLQSTSEDDLALLEEYLKFREHDGCNIIQKCNFLLRDDATAENALAGSY